MWCWFSTRGQQSPEQHCWHIPDPSTLSFQKPDRWMKSIYIWCVYVCVFSYVYVQILYVHVRNHKRVFVNILPCQVHFYSLTVTLLSLSLSFNMKGESAIHIHMCSGWSPLKSSPSLINVQCDSEVTEGQISSMQLILSQKQTSASDPPTALNSDLIFLRTLLLSPFSFSISEQTKPFSNNCPTDRR